MLHLREENERLKRGLLGQKAERLPKNDAQLSLISCKRSASPVADGGERTGEVCWAMRGAARQFEHDATEDVGVQDLLSLAFLEGLAPVRRGELEDAVAGPTGHQAEQVAHVREGLEFVEAAAGQERHEDGVGLASVVAADEEPVLPIMKSSP